jgi:hypothetical protein
VNGDGRTPLHARTPAIVAAGMTPGLSWAVLLLVAPLLDENMCGTAASPHRGSWFGWDVRVPIAALGGVALLATIAAAVLLTSAWQWSHGRSDRHARTRAFIAGLGLLSLGLFVPIVVASLIPLLVVGPC